MAEHLTDADLADIEAGVSPYGEPLPAPPRPFNSRALLEFMWGIMSAAEGQGDAPSPVEGLGPDVFEATREMWALVNAMRGNTPHRVVLAMIERIAALDEQHG